MVAVPPLPASSLARLMAAAVGDAHWPPGEVLDPATGAQWFFHRHAEPQPADEIGHFHLFLRPPGLPRGAVPIPVRGQLDRPRGRAAFAHLVGVALAPDGRVCRLFTTNQWVTGESFFSATLLASCLDRYAIQHDWPDIHINQWLRDLVALHADRVAALLVERDRSLRAEKIVESFLLIDRQREILSSCLID